MTQLATSGAPPAAWTRASPKDWSCPEMPRRRGNPKAQQSHGDGVSIAHICSSIDVSKLFCSCLIKILWLRVVTLWNLNSGWTNGNSLFQMHSLKSQVYLTQVIWSIITPSKIDDPSPQSRLLALWSPRRSKCRTDFVREFWWLGRRKKPGTRRTNAPLMSSCKNWRKPCMMVVLRAYPTLPVALIIGITHPKQQW